MVDCSCYHDEKNFLGKRGVCWGTKEREACSCGGDAAKCDFYPDKRKMKKETNYDRVHALDEEELAAFLAIITTGDTSDRVRWLKWLRQGVKD